MKNCLAGLSFLLLLTTNTSTYATETVSRAIENEIKFEADIDIDGITKSSDFLNGEETALESFNIEKKSFTVLRGPEKCPYTRYGYARGSRGWGMSTITKENRSYLNCIKKIEVSIFDTPEDESGGYPIEETEQTMDHVLIIDNISPTSKYVPHEEDSNLNRCLVRQQREFRDAYEDSEDFKELLNNLKVHRINIVVNTFDTKDETIGPGPTKPSENLKYGFNITRDRKITINLLYNEENGKCYASTEYDFIDATERVKREVEDILHERRSVLNSIDSFNEFLQKGNQQEYPQCGKS